jgi:hypothetical protein
MILTFIQIQISKQTMDTKQLRVCRTIRTMTFPAGLSRIPPGPDQMVLHTLVCHQSDRYPYSHLASISQDWSLTFGYAASPLSIVSMNWIELVIVRQ